MADTGHEHPVTLEYVVDKLVTYGSPVEVIDKLHEFREVTGPFNHLVYAGHDWADPALGRRSMELMAERVVPELRTTVAASERASA